VADESSKLVMRTADGPARNKLRTGATITLILDQPSDVEDAYLVVSEDRKYNQTLAAVMGEELAPGAKVLRFSGVDPDKSYKIFHVQAKGATRAIVSQWTPWSKLTAKGQLPQFSRYFVFNPLASGRKQPADRDLVARLEEPKFEDPKV
jgi:hypothetical protein